MVSSSQEQYKRTKQTDGRADDARLNHIPDGHQDVVISKPDKDAATFQ
jgi:hypothetical protein